MIQQLERRDLGKEQQSLKDILGTRGGEFKGFDQDAAIKAKLDKEIQRKTYGTARPVFMDDKKYNIPRLKKEANRPTVMETAELYKKQADEARPERLAQITEKAQRIEDPFKRNSFIAAAQAADNNKIGGILERALNVYSAEDERRQKALQEALALYNADLEQSQALEAADLENEAIDELRRAGIITDEMMLQKQLKDLGFSLPKSSGRGGGRRGGGKTKKGKYTRETNEVGGYSFFDPDGNPITAEEYAAGTGKYVNQVLSGSQDLGDQEFLLDYDQQLDAMKDRDLSPEEFRNSLELAYPHIYGKAFDVERQRVPIKKTEDDDEEGDFSFVQ